MTAVLELTYVAGFYLPIAVVVIISALVAFVVALEPR